MKKFLISISIIIFATAVWGGIASSSHSALNFAAPETIKGLKVSYRMSEDDFMSASELMSKYQLSEDEVGETETLPERLISEYENANYIAVVESAGIVNNVAGTLVQDATLVKAIKGDLRESESFHLAMPDAGFYLNDNLYYGIFCNIMKKGKRYLAFFHAIDGGLYTKQNYYRLCNTNCVPYLCLDDLSNKIVYPDPAIDEMAVPYAAVQDNEFFVENEAANRGIQAFKRDILEKYIG
jgi:hypothetical protein